MSKDNVTEHVTRLVEPVLASLGLDLIEVQLLGQGRKSILRLYVDKPGGVTLGDCEQVSRLASPIFDVEDPIQHPYTLEVSSPGIDRPFTRLEDYRRHTGRLIRVETEEEGVRTTRTGRLVAVGDQTVQLLTDQGVHAAIPISSILLARCEVPFKRA